MTRWNRFYRKQFKNKKLRTMVEQELDALRIGAKSAALREEEKFRVSFTR